jgi:hypothetical protein
MENRAASAATLAKAVMMGMDASKEFTQVQTQTLILLCRAVIDAMEENNPTARAIQTSHSAFVASRISGAEGR